MNAGIGMLNKDRLKELFSYCDGKLIRKISVSRNTKAGDIAGCLRGKYLSVRVDGIHELVHRIIYVMFKGYTSKLVDHKDRDRLNNKIENLRSATRSENNRNSKKPSTNTSGIKGVHWRSDRCRWFSKVDINGKTFYGGHFKDIKDAEKSIKKLRALHHKEFSNDG